MTTDYEPRHLLREKPFINSARIYDFLNWVAKVILPGLSAAYYGLAELWNLPYVAQIVGTIAVIDTFLGLVIAYSKKTYDESEAKFDGELYVDTENEIMQVQVRDRAQLEDIRSKGEVTFEVRQPIRNTSSDSR